MKRKEKVKKEDLRRWQGQGRDVTSGTTKVQKKKEEKT